MNPVIRLFFGDVERFKPDQTTLKRWIGEVIQLHHGRCKRLGIVFCSDEELLKLNRDYLNHQTLTDIITFPYHEEGNPIEAELYISIDRIKENAAEMGIPDWREELHRVIIHGVLHLLGFEDTTLEEKEEMRRQEDYCLSLRA
jgi:probable rRNA maturation factor